MAGCCDPSGYPGVFNKATARRSVKNFVARGLDSTAGPMVAALTGLDIAGASILEVGAGSGTALVSLVEAGAAAATAVDLSPAYEPEARTLFSDRGVSAPLEWRTGDFVAVAPELAPHDVVLLNRVVCCYPHMEDLIDAAGSKSNRLLALAFPRRRLVVKLFVRMSNVWLRLRRNSFRVFVHDPRLVARRVAGLGFGEVASGSTVAWEWHVWERS